MAAGRQVRTYEASLWDGAPAQPAQPLRQQRPQPQLLQREQLPPPQQQQQVPLTLPLQLPAKPLHRRPAPSVQPVAAGTSSSLSSSSSSSSSSSAAAAAASASSSSSSSGVAAAAAWHATRSQASRGLGSPSASASSSEPGSPSSSGSSAALRGLKRVRVAVRCRPALSAESAPRSGSSSVPVVRIERGHHHGGRARLSIDGVPKAFSFDHVFGGESRQEEIYEVVRPIVADVLEGTSGAILAYGQTGTGKTYTMGILERIEPVSGAAGGGEEPTDEEEAADEDRGREDFAAQGIVPGALRQLFRGVRAACCRSASASASACGCRWTVSISFLQIYLETLQDLLAPLAGGRVEDNLMLRECPREGFYVQGLRSFPVRSFAEAAALINLGLENRQMACTSMNTSSSRSHTVLTVELEVRPCPARKRPAAQAKLRMVDLAGSERVGSGSAPASTASAGGEDIPPGQCKTLAVADKLASADRRARIARGREARAINVSLSALGNVVAALAQRSALATATAEGGRSSVASSVAGTASSLSLSWASSTLLSRTSAPISAAASAQQQQQQQQQQRQQLQQQQQQQQRRVRPQAAASAAAAAAAAASSVHVPFRDSKLTRLLADTLGAKGGCNTALIATVGPDQCSARETVCTLNFAARCLRVRIDSAVEAAHPSSGNHSKLCEELQKRLDVAELEFAQREAGIRRAYESEISDLKRRMGLTQTAASTLHEPPQRAERVLYELYADLMLLSREYRDRLSAQRASLEKFVRSEFACLADASEEPQQGQGRGRGKSLAASTLQALEKALAPFQERAGDSSLAAAVAAALELPADVVTPALLRPALLPRDSSTPAQLSLHAKATAMAMRLEAEAAHSLLDRLMSELVRLYVEGSKRDDDLLSCSKVLNYLLQTNADLRADLRATASEPPSRVSTLAKEQEHGREQDRARRDAGAAGSTLRTALRTALPGMSQLDFFLRRREQLPEAS